MFTTAQGNASATLSGRELALQRRQAMAHSGKAGVLRAPAAALTKDGEAGRTRLAQAARVDAAMPGQVEPAAIAKVASGRQASMQRRKALSSSGRAGLASSTAPRASGRMRARAVGAAMPSMAEPGHTPTGKSISGTMSALRRKGTGNEQGGSRNVTGTNDIGGESLDALRVSRPVTVPSKVSVSHTGGGQRVTGTMVGRGSRQTGDESGSCRPVTGTEYLSTEHFRDVCRTSAPAAPRKVSVMSTRGEQTLSGTSVDRSGRVTGNEVGSCRSITGSQYYTTADFAGLCETPTPRKVGRMETVGGRVVTGSEVAPSPKLSGDETFGLQPVTGTDYIGTRQLAQLGATDGVAPVDKVVVDMSLGGQKVSGSYPGRAVNVTGNEAGTCSLVSGDQFQGVAALRQFCPPDSAARHSALVRDSASIPATVVTGDRPGAGGSAVTGDERGSCGAVTGTPYLGVDNRPTNCTAGGRFGLRGQAPVPVAEAPQREFSIMTPARQGRERRSGSVTGSALENARITGPVNKAAGLITGTPDFRHADTAWRQAKDETCVAAAQRVSGEGNQQGRRISGDAWNADPRVSGTEGTSSLARNPSQRGQPRGVGSSAAGFRNLERPEIPDAVITGSAGSARRGAAVTVSGGARG